MSIIYNCEEGCNLPSSPNDIKILLKNLIFEIEKLKNDTEASLLLHDGKIAELCKYIKDNLSNSIRCLLDSMKLSGELDLIIKDVVQESYRELINRMDKLNYSSSLYEDLLKENGGIL